MILSSLALVLCSCLSSCEPVAEAKNYEELQNAATEMIKEAAEELIQTMVGALSQIWKTFCDLFKFGGAIGIGSVRKQIKMV